MWISFLSDKINSRNLQTVGSSITSGNPGLFDNSNFEQLSRNCPQKLGISDYAISKH